MRVDLSDAARAALTKTKKGSSIARRTLWNAYGIKAALARVVARQHWHGAPGLPMNPP
jgi:hypothetical protein